MNRVMPQRPFTSTISGWFALGTSAFLGACGEPQLAKRENPPPIPPPQAASSYPVTRTLTNLEGRSFEAEIWGKVGDSLYVLRRSDGMEAVIPISRLSREDRILADALPSQAPPTGFSPDSTPLPEAPRPIKREVEVGNFVTSRQKEIEKLHEENSELASEMAGATNRILIRSNEAMIQKNLDEISRLQEAIDRYRSGSR